MKGASTVWVAHGDVEMIGRKIRKMKDQRSI